MSLLGGGLISFKNLVVWKRCIDDVEVGKHGCPLWILTNSDGQGDYPLMLDHYLHENLQQSTWPKLSHSDDYRITLGHYNRYTI